MKRRQFLAAALAAPLAVRAQGFPAKPITWVVGFPPGGGADGVTRLVAAKLSQNVGQPVVVENRPGASSIIAAQYVAQAAADGYTIWSTEQGGLIFNAALYSKLPYDPQHDFAPVTDMVQVPLLLVVNPSFPATDFKGFVDEVRKQPGKHHFGSPGRGLAHHLAMERLKSDARLDIVDVQYKGIAPVIQDLLAGQIPMAAVDTVPLLQHLRSGKLRALAAFSNKRLSVAPDVPALGELGYQNIQIAPIVGVAVPGKTPQDVIGKLNAELVRALRDPEVNGKLTGLGLEVIGDTPEQFAAFLDAEGKRWLPFIRSLNLKLD
ncbi:MAG TPA: tripartite tricarboxylate transporter substrate-binding protein [Burkholderiales bacterium]|nr:tripartite tricarboxylate transporter substrate-binding protein [Burkholderiales bacterium]